MKARERALYATSALLYSGPLYAGLAGYGSDTVPLFAIIFTLWLFVVRPGDWPRTAAAWRNARAVAWPLTIFGVQMLLVLFCLAVGRGLGGLMGVEPPLPLVFTVLVSMLAIAVARLLQRKRGARESLRPEGGLAIGAGVIEIGVPEMPDPRVDEDFIDAIMAALSDVDERGAPRAALAPIAGEIERKVMAAAVLEALAGGPDTLAVRQMEAEIALRPGVARTIVGHGQIGRAVTRAIETGKPRVVEATAVAAARLLIELPEAAREMPPVRRLIADAAKIKASAPGAARALRSLAETLENIPGD